MKCELAAIDGIAISLYNHRGIVVINIYDYIRCWIIRIVISVGNSALEMSWFEIEISISKETLFMKI